MNLDQIQKLTQALFYGVAIVLSILTYLSAKRVLLNTVNTEYQKRVLDRLVQLCTELASEFDRESETYWVTDQPIKEGVTKLNAQFSAARKEILTEGVESWPGIPVTSTQLRLAEMIRKVQNDILIPRAISDAVSTFLSDRAEVMMTVYTEEFEDYKAALASGKHNNSLETNWNWVHNKVNSRLYAQGCGVSQIEDEVREVVLAIQEYLERFNPVPFRRRHLPKKLRLP